MSNPTKRAPRIMSSMPVMSVLTLALAALRVASSMNGLPESAFLRMAPSTMRWFAVR